MSSPSVAYYHITKLLKAGLLKEEDDGYVPDKAVFENMIRIRRTVLPLQVGYAAFFTTALIVMVTLMRPSQLSSAYVFAIVVVIVAVGVALLEAFKVMKPPI